MISLLASVLILGPAIAHSPCVSPVLVTCLIARPIRAQDPGDSRPTKDPDPVDLFRKTAAGQVAGGKPVAIQDFQAELEVTIHDTDEKTKERTRRSATVIQYYRDRGAQRPLFRRHLIDKIQGTTTVQGYDGKSFWQQLGTTPARSLQDRESKDERARIIEEMNRTKDYLRFLFLANLDGPDVTFKYGGKRKIKANGEDRDVEVVVLENPKEQPLELLIGRSEGKPVLFGFTRKLEGGKTETIAFSVHRLVRSGGITALVPLVAEYRQDGVLTFEARAPNENSIKFNTNLEDRLFAIPR